MLSSAARESGGASLLSAHGLPSPSCAPPACTPPSPPHPPRPSPQQLQHERLHFGCAKGLSHAVLHHCVRGWLQSEGGQGGSSANEVTNQPAAVACTRALRRRSRPHPPLPRPPPFKSWSAYSITMNTASSEGPTTTSLTFTMLGWSRLRAGTRRQGVEGFGGVGLRRHARPPHQPASQPNQPGLPRCRPPQEDVDLAHAGEREAVPLLVKLDLFQRADLAGCAVARPGGEGRGGGGGAGRVRCSGVQAGKHSGAGTRTSPAPGRLRACLYTTP